jgi:hypothetical protein
VVDVQMRAQDEVDRLARRPRVRKVGEKWRVAHVPIRNDRPLFAIPKTSVHQDSPATRFDNEGVDTDDELSFGIQKRR